MGTLSLVDLKQDVEKSFAYGNNSIDLRSNHQQSLAESQNVEWKESWRDEYLKWICGFANAQGGVLYIGINDEGTPVGLKNLKSLLEDIPNKIVMMLGIVADVNLQEKNGINYIEIIVHKSNMPIAYKGVYHYRSGSTKQELKGQALQDFLLKKLGMTWDDMIEEKATIADINPDAIMYFQRMAIANKRMEKEAMTDDILSILENLNLVSDDGKLKKAALLLFGKNPSKFVAIPFFRIGRFKKDYSDLLFQDSVECDLIRMADRVMDLLKSKYLISPIRYEGLQRIEALEIPEESLREAIFNAIIHKDYTGAHIQMRVWDDRIELWNDGGLPYDMSIEKLLEPHSSKPRNVHIASVFYKAGFIESWGRGIQKIQTGFQDAGIKAPMFEESCGGIQVTLYRNNFETIGKKNDGVCAVVKTVHKKEKTRDKVFCIIKENPNITQPEIAEKLSLSKSAIEYQIRQLKEAGVIERIGSDKTGCWKVNDK